MKLVVIGSCFSASVANAFLQQVPHFVSDGSLAHFRTDELTELLEGSDSSSLVIDQDREAVVKFLLREATVSNVNQLRSKVDAHSESKFEEFLEKLRQANLIIFDNNYDLLGVRFSFNVDANAYNVGTLNLDKISEEIVSHGKLPVENLRISDFYNKFFSSIRSFNRKARIVFLNYPIDGFERRGLKADLERMSRHRFYSSLELEKELSVDFVDAEGMVNASELSDKGPFYFKSSVYHRYAAILRSLLRLDEPTSLSDHHPYEQLPESSYWKPAVAEVYPLAIKGLYRKKFDITGDKAVATCGSCFAQHIGRRLNRKGYNYVDIEPKPEGLDADKAKALGYGIYSARYGNVYTSRQLIQLFSRAFGELDFDEVWRNESDRYVDPFRPNLCGDGYATPEEVLGEQRSHLQNVRRMFETLDVFIFTMGLTETWVNRQTGAVYPICPGVTAGTFDPDLYEFVNLDYATILDEMELFLQSLKKVNPTAKVLLTVSPVPLTATAENRHVLISTMVSKSILRSVADQLYRRHAHVDYFPSYDIIISPPYKSMFFKSNLRSIHEEGVDYVMSHFFAEHHLKASANPERVDAPSTFARSEIGTPEEEDDEAFCDEAFLELERKGK